MADENKDTPNQAKAEPPDPSAAGAEATGADPVADPSESALPSDTRTDTAAAGASVTASGDTNAKEDATTDAAVRRRGARTLAIAGAVLLALAFPALWIQALATNTDAWLAAVGPVANDPVVQEEVVGRAADAIGGIVKPGRIAEEQLPDNLKFLAIPIGGAVDSLITQKTREFVQSPQFKALWIDMNATAHRTLKLVVNGGDRGFLDSDEGTFSLDLGALVSAIGDRFADEGYAFADGLGTNLEAKDARIVLLTSSALASVQGALSALHVVAFLLATLGIAGIAAAVFVAPDRRRGGIEVAAAAAGALLIVLLIIGAAPSAVGGAATAATGIGAPALAGACTIVLAPLRELLTGALAIAAIAWIALFLAGPARPAQAIRSHVGKAKKAVSR